MIDLNEAQDFLKKIMIEAGALTLEYRESFKSLRVEQKGTDKDLVTEADQAVEVLLRKRILERYPDHAILGEEEGESGTHACRWIIDPIDGTISYLHGQYQYSVSIALEVEGTLELGAVFAPALADLFTARRGEGAFLNEKSISVSAIDRLGDAVLSTGFCCIRAGMQQTNLPLFCDMMPRIRDIRRGGSAALDLCLVACGQMDGYWEKHINLYDIAAGMLVLEEAGGEVTDYKGDLDGLPREILATNGLIHDECISVIRPFIR
ncbi:inositol monophosphatase family protein [Oceanispirochaeta sp.]|uniref:inositol monophosphatase family protein n=1 Tax=Oceanispirochaeta sp. TaxID=2035350 RepID=UPI00261D2430|nr:inositol monophosphatase family protein [Oceanispirochaeta sp.]MDA3957995.1 inositol monophosphatase family protein [Oceanispirochaeta sp.]